MQIRLSAFPVVYFNVRCKRHECNVEAHVNTTKLVRNSMVVGAEIASMRCETGKSQCTDDWELIVMGLGPIVVE